MKLPKISLSIFFVLFFAANSAYIHRVPGLLGDEGSEGENVYQLLHAEHITIIGERSYIGPLIDYIRVPYVAVFGYTALALRMVMLTFSVATFFLAYSVLRRLFGEEVGTIALAAFAFSPIFLLQQRLGWAITLNVFFAWLLLYTLMSKTAYKWLLVGLVAGLGLSNDIIFFPTLAAIFICSAIIYLCSQKFRERALVLASSAWLVGIGFIAGFGTQFAVLLLFQDDQGSRAEVSAQFMSRLHDFLPSLPLYLSGSSYVARYTGMEFLPSLIFILTLVLSILIAIGLFHKKRIVVLAFLGGLSIHSVLLLYMVDRFTLRYFASLSMFVWMLAGVGLGIILKRFLPHKAVHAAPIVLSLLLVCWTASTVLIPFLRTGGSLNEFSLGNRNDKSSAFVDIGPLVSCVRGKGAVYSPSQDIFDRLLYLGRQYEDIQVVNGDHKKSAQIVVSYKKQGDDTPTLCPELNHFKVVEAK